MAKHLNQYERKILHCLLQADKSPSEIGRLMKRHRTTICREIERNSGQRGYRPQQAQRLAEERRRNSRRPEKLANAELRREVIEQLQTFWSPDQIAGTLQRERPHEPQRRVSRQTIYNWIARQPDRSRWRQCLRLAGRQRGPDSRGKVPRAVSIEGRPKIVDRRQRYGDWEGDTMVGKGRRSGLFTAVDRKSGFLQMVKVDDLCAETVRMAAQAKLGALHERLRKTLTLDNGKEFSQHEALAERLGLDVFFAQPYCAWQRGTNENTNGLIRQFFPKGTDFTRIRDDEIARVETSLNERPRRRHGYQTPSAILAKHCRRIRAFET